MSNTIATGKGEHRENRLIDAPDETDNRYRLDVGGIKFLFDEVEMSDSRETITFHVTGRTVGAISTDILADRVEGALSVLSRNS